MKRCQHCGHSNAAHVGGVRCALCGCVPQRQTFVQDAFAFRSGLARPEGSLPQPATDNGRKR
jgi:hypothetical protein